MDNVMQETTNTAPHIEHPKISSDQIMKVLYDQKKEEIRWNRVTGREGTNFRLPFLEKLIKQIENLK